VKAADKGTGKENKITIKANSGLSEDEIQKMVNDAAAHAEEDKRQHELIDARNQCEALIHTTKKALSEHGEKVSVDERAKIEAAMKEAEDVLKSEDKATIEAKAQALATASQKLGEAMYAQQQAAGGAAPEAGKPADDNVVDAEFTEVKDGK